MHTELQKRPGKLCAVLRASASPCEKTPYYPQTTTDSLQSSRFNVLLSVQNTQSSPDVFGFTSLCQEVTSSDTQFAHGSQIYHPAEGRDLEVYDGE